MPCRWAEGSDQPTHRDSARGKGRMRTWAPGCRTGDGPLGTQRRGTQLSPAGCHLHPPKGTPLPQAPSVAPTPARVTLGNCVPSLKSIQMSPLQVRSRPRRCPLVPTPRGSGPVPRAPCSPGALAQGTGRRLRSAVEVAPPTSQAPRPPPQQGFDVAPSPRGSPRVCLLDPRHIRPW